MQNLRKVVFLFLSFPNNYKVLNNNKIVLGKRLELLGNVRNSLEQLGTKEKVFALASRFFFFF